MVRQAKQHPGRRNVTNSSFERVARRQIRLERELFIWRLLVIIVAAGAMLAAASPQPEKEIRLASADGKNTVILSAEGLFMMSGGRRLAQLTFETVGDGSQQVALLKLNGQVNVESGIISVGSPLKQRAADRADGFSLIQGGIVRGGISPGLLTLADASGRTKAELIADEQGLAALSHGYSIASEIKIYGTEPSIAVADGCEMTFPELKHSRFRPSILK